MSVHLYETVIWVSLPVFKFRRGDANFDFVNRCLLNMINRYVLIIDTSFLFALFQSLRYYI